LRPGKDPTGKLAVLPRPLDGFQEALRGRGRRGKGEGTKGGKGRGGNERGAFFPTFYNLTTDVQ